MAPSQHSVLVLLGLIASVHGISCPACYTQTVAGIQHCPFIPAATAACYEPACVKVVTTTIPGKNPACSATPTVTTTGACPTTATCRKGCRTSIKTVTGSSLSCGVSWETDAPNTGGVSWATDPAQNTGGVSWATDPAQNTGGVSWATGPTDNTGGVSWATQPADSTGGVSWATQPADSTGGVSWETTAPSASITWGKRQEIEPTEVPEPEGEEPDETIIVNLPTPTNDIELGDPDSSVTWGKRQDEEEPEPTAEPEPTEEPEPSATPEDESPVPSGVIIIEPPESSVIWGKRQDEEEPEPEPTDLPTPSNTIGVEPPDSTVIWGKRQDGDEPETPDEPPAIIIPSFPKPSNVISLGKPTGWISWYKRQEIEDPEPTEEPTGPVEVSPPEFTPPNTIGIEPPSVSVSWGKREDLLPRQTNDVGLEPPSGTVIWGKREPAPASDSMGLHLPSTSAAAKPTKPTTTKPKTTKKPTKPKTTSSTSSEPYLSWGKRDAQVNTIGLQFPTNLVSWWTAIPKPTEEAQISWAKRDPQVNTIGLQFPTNFVSWWTWFPKPTSVPYISWDKREPQDLTIPPVVVIGQPTDTVGVLPPDATISWYTATSDTGSISWAKRNAAPAPTAAPVLAERADSKSACGITTTITKITPCPMIACPAIKCVAPLEEEETTYTLLSKRAEPSEHATPDCPVTLTAARVCPTCPTCPPITKKPTMTASTALPPKSTLPYCATTATTIIPPCVPPMCPDNSIACDLNKRAPTFEKKVKEREPEVVKTSYITFVSSYYPTPKPTPTCSGTKTLTAIASCPTYTCVPVCDPAQVVR